jgi:hypothetical protein
MRMPLMALPARVLYHLSLPSTPPEKLVKQALADARTRAGVSYWKQYGVRSLPASGQQETDIGHNAHWAAPDTMAADIDAFIKTGAPTADLPHSSQAPDISQMSSSAAIPPSLCSGAKRQLSSRCQDFASNRVRPADGQCRLCSISPAIRRTDSYVPYRLHRAPRYTTANRSQTIGALRLNSRPRRWHSRPKNALWARCQ